MNIDLLRAVALAVLLILPVELKARAGFLEPGSKPVELKSFGKLITSLCQTRDGRVWAMAEERGFAFRGVEGTWREVSDPACPVGKFSYAMCGDKLGRLWVGQLNTGVAVYNGESWMNYDVLTGPVGEHLFDIACSPVDGDVWMATSAGISRYSDAIQSWTHYTRTQGLPADQANALEFAPDGTLYIGTQCDGLAIGSPTDQYRTWTVVQSQQTVSDLRQPTGKGLPDDQVNDVLVASDGTIYLATSSGIAKSTDRGKSWTYLRGRDYADKVRGRYEPPPKNWKPASKDVLNQLLPEDYVTCLAEDPTGCIWVGFRRFGCLVLNPATGATLAIRAGGKGLSLSDDYVNRLLPLPDGDMLVATYGGGLDTLPAAALADFRKKAVPPTKPISINNDFKGDYPPLPAEAKLLTVAEMEAALKEVQQAGSQPVPKVYALNDDWRTQGNWIGRYGEFGAGLCAMGGGGFDVYSGEHEGQFDHRGWMGRNFKEPGDSLRFWVHWIDTDDVRSLQYPERGGRKQSEWDDHGEVYPLTLDGPHVYGSVRLQKGYHLLSFYFFNKDGQSGSNRWRDFVIDLRPTEIPMDSFYGLGFGKYAENVFNRSKGSRQRVRDFRGGVYKRFFVRSEHDDEVFTLKVSRSHSFNTIMSGIFDDHLISVDQENIFNTGNRLPPRQSLIPPAKEFSVKPDTALAYRLLDSILIARDKSPIHAAATTRPLQLRLAQTLMERRNDGRCFAEELEGFENAHPPETEDQPSIELRPSIGLLLEGLQLFDESDLVYFKPSHHGRWKWEEHSTHRNSKGDYTYESRMRYLHKNKAKERKW